jgi:GNAT superfamily N-acetyltransferase
VTFRRLGPDDPALAAVLALIRDAFAPMDGVVDPPSSVHRLTLAELAGAEVWAAGDPPVACGVMTPRADALYLGKIAVAGDWRGRGLARGFMAAAEARARALGLPDLELQSRPRRPCSARRRSS